MARRPAARGLLVKLAAALGLLMLAVGAFSVLLTLAINRFYLVEMQQRINRDIAEHIVHDEILLRDGEVERDGLEHVFHMMMVIHPSIELYLLDAEGRILAFSAPEGRVTGERVPLEPVRAFLAGERLPILGDDPRHPGSGKPFSAAEIRGDDGLEGYLYIVVGGEQYASAVSQLAGSYAARLGVGLLLLGQLLALCMGYFVVRWIVRRLGALRDGIERFERSGFREAPPAASAADDHRGDEIDELRRSFESMGRRISGLLAEIEHADGHRRELVASVSHDLRTPLAALRGYLETLSLKEGQLSLDERRRYLEIAQRQALRLQRLIDDLFELSQLEARQVELRPEPFSLAELVQDVVQKFQLAAGDRGIELSIDVTRSVPLVRGDVGLIERVVTNLLDNALKYTGRGGSIRVATHGEGQAVTVSVRDTGRGIPADELPRVFDRFYRGREVRADGAEGTGLGLAIASAIVDLHAGSIDAASRPGEGTTFSVSLPV